MEKNNIAILFTLAGVLLGGALVHNYYSEKLDTCQTEVKELTKYAPDIGLEEIWFIYDRKVAVTNNQGVYMNEFNYIEKRYVNGTDLLFIEQVYL